MAESEFARTDKRPRSRKLIEDMLRERQQMLVLLWELSKLDLSRTDPSNKETLDEFHEILVDYIAAGHFGLYQRISEGKERRQPVLDTAREIFPRIARTTDMAVEFSEKYEGAKPEAVQSGLMADLSVLAEEITTRIELEDKLIFAMLGEEYAIPRHDSPG